MRVPKRKSEEFRKYKDEGGPLYVTSQGLEKLKSQLAHTEKELPLLIAEVQRTGGFGDFSENAEYQAAKYLMRRAHGRIASLKDKIKRAIVFGRGGSPAYAVQLGSCVTVETQGKRLTLEIVGSYETDPARGRISHESPLGAALMNRKVGERVMLRTKSGETEYTVLNIQ